MDPETINIEGGAEFPSKRTLQLAQIPKFVLVLRPQCAGVLDTRRRIAQEGVEKGSHGGRGVFWEG